jgi:hypothetical protein
MQHGKPKAKAEKPVEPTPAPVTEPTEPEAPQEAKVEVGGGVQETEQKRPVGRPKKTEE